MAKRNNNILLLEKLETLLKGHDWYYMMSDDKYWYDRGRQEAKAIQDCMEECINNDLGVMARDIYHNHNPSYKENV